MLFVVPTLIISMGLPCSPQSKSLFSNRRYGFKKRTKLLHTTMRIIAIFKLLGIIQDEKSPEEFSNIGENVNLPDNLSEERKKERKSAKTKIRLTTDDIEDDEDVNISKVTQMFGKKFIRHPLSLPFVKTVISSESSI